MELKEAMDMVFSSTCDGCVCEFTPVNCTGEECKIAEAKITIKDAVEKQNKYQWHDLRKNTDDLPDNGHEILVRIDCEQGVWYQTCHYEDDFYDALTGQYCTPYVIGWRKIEPFLQEEEVE